MAGGRFNSPTEAGYAPVEGECLGIAWALEQTRYFTIGCDKLLILTDHKPIVKIFGDRVLDEITNPRIFKLKQKTLQWKFTPTYVPGKKNQSANATSRYPALNDSKA